MSDECTCKRWSIGCMLCNPECTTVGCLFPKHHSMSICNPDLFGRCKECKKKHWNEKETICHPITCNHSCDVKRCKSCNTILFIIHETFCRHNRDYYRNLALSL